MTDCCIIGGGIIGLSIARALAGRGLSVRVLSRERERSTASWAAAGILPPAPPAADATAGEALTAWSDRLHREWAADLLEETGIDNGLRSCGGLHLAADHGAAERLRVEARDWLRRGARCEMLEPAAVAACEPALGPAVGRDAIAAAYLLPDEMQIRPPRHLEALVRSCRSRGVEIIHETSVESIDVRGGRIVGVVARGTDAGAARANVIRADRYCLTAGAWSAGLLEPLGLRIETRPIRGQIALVRLPAPALTRVINQGLDYVVPREDGLLLVGSTIEDAGFDATTTPAAIDRLLAFARGLLGGMPGATLERSWAGLRPGSPDGRPFIGPLPACPNGFVASGHFRAGLHQSTGTAVLMADLITGSRPSIDPAPFAPDRPAVEAPEGQAPPGSLAACLARAAAGSG
ncbi:MAG: FAD-dependent oxidoreductase [Planctomycetia bacterium]|nr:FAD-dependent oxidoreductase [Planctomycetia bacterium]